MKTGRNSTGKNWRSVRFGPICFSLLLAAHLLCSSAAFAQFTISPAITNLTPANGTIVNAQPKSGTFNTLSITWDVSTIAKTSGGEAIYITTPSDGKNPFETIAAKGAAVSVSGSTATITFSSSLANDGTTYTVLIDEGAFTSSGNDIAEVNNWSFTTLDAIDPFTTSISPAHSATGQTVDLTVSLTFNEEIRNGNNASTGYISVYRDSDDALIDQFRITDSRVSKPTVSSLDIDLGGIIDYSETYYVVFDAGLVEDMQNNQNAALGRSDILFTTEADTFGPQLLSTIPAAGDTTLSNNSPITFKLIFDEPIVAQSSWVRLKDTTDASNVYSWSITSSSYASVDGDTLILEVPNSYNNQPMKLSTEGVTNWLTDGLGNSIGTALEDFGLHYKTIDTVSSFFRWYTYQPTWDYNEVLLHEDLNAIFSWYGSGVKKNTGHIYLKEWDSGCCPAYANNDGGHVVDSIDVNDPGVTFDTAADGSAIVRVDFDTTLQENASYTLSYDSAAFLNADGYAFPSQFASTSGAYNDFALILTKDFTPPKLSSLQPDTVKTGEFTMIFNEPVEFYNLDVDIFRYDNDELVHTEQLFNSGTGSVVGSSNYDTLIRFFESSIRTGAKMYAIPRYDSIIDRGLNHFDSVFTKDTWVFQTVDQSPPAIKNSTPVDSTTDAPQTDPIRINFGEPVTLNTASSSTKYLLSNDGCVNYPYGLRSYSFTNLDTLVSVVNDSIVSLELPIVNGKKPILDPLCEYTLDIYSNAVTDSVGIGNLSSSFTFTTGGDTTVPAIISTFPTKGATGVPINTNYGVRFSDTVGFSRLDAGYIYVTDTATGGSFRIDTQEKWDSYGVSYGQNTDSMYAETISKTAGLNLLDTNTVYSVTFSTISLSLENSSGRHFNPTPYDTTWYFRTEEQTDFTSPSVTAVYPADESTGVDTAAVFSMVFDESVYKYRTISNSAIILELWENGVRVAYIPGRDLLDQLNGFTTDSLAVDFGVPLKSNSSYSIHYNLGAFADRYNNTTFNNVTGLWDFETILTPPDKPAFTQFADTVCTETTVTYTIDAVPGASSYTWSYGGTGATLSTTSGTSVDVTYGALATDGILSVVASNSEGSSAPLELSVVVQQPPSAPTSFTSSSTSVCAGISGVTYSIDPVSGADSYTWSYSGSDVSITGSGTSVDLDFGSAATSGTLSVTANKGCGSSTALTTSVTVNYAPGSTIFTSAAAQVCEGATGQSYAISTAAGADSYSWSYSGTGVTISGSGTSVSLDFASGATSGTLSVTADNSCGSGPEAGFSITVNPNPGTPVFDVGPAQVYQGQSVDYTVSSTGAATMAWDYTGSGTTYDPSGFTNTLNFSSSATGGDLRVQSQANGCFSDISTMPITVNPAIQLSASGFSGSTGSGVNVVVTEDVTLSSDVTLGDLVVEPGVTITITGEAVINIEGMLESDNPVVVESGSALITYASQNNTTEAEVQRATSYPASSGSYSFMGTTVEQNSSNTGADLGSNVYRYDESIGFGADGINRWVDASADELVPGVGYTSAFLGQLTLVGVPNDGTITVSGLTHTTGAATNANDRGWNLLANPYPAAIDADAFLTANTNIDGSIYIWDDHGSEGGRGDDSDYLVYNGIGATGPNSGSTFDGKLASSQGFFVRVSSATSGTSVDFTESMRFTTSGNNNDFFRTKEDIRVLRLSLTTEGRYAETLVGFTSEATSGTDRLYDALKPDGNAMIQLYSLLEDEPLAIQGLPEALEANMELGFVTGKSGSYQITMVENTSSESLDWLLTDLYEDKTVSISSGIYTFQSSQGRFNDRFRLQAVERVTGFSTEGNWEVHAGYQEGNLILYSNESATDPMQITILDLNGKRVHTQDIQHIRARNQVSLKVPAGVYLVRINRSDQVRTLKFIAD